MNTKADIDNKIKNVFESFINKDKEFWDTILSKANNTLVEKQDKLNRLEIHYCDVFSYMEKKFEPEFVSVGNGDDYICFEANKPDSKILSFTLSTNLNERFPSIFLETFSVGNNFFDDTYKSNITLSANTITYQVIYNNIDYKCDLSSQEATLNFSRAFLLDDPIYDFRYAANSITAFTNIDKIRLIEFLIEGNPFSREEIDLINITHEIDLSKANKVFLSNESSKKEIINKKNTNNFSS